MDQTASSRRPAISATMSPMTAPRVIAAALAGAALTLTGCSLLTPSADPTAAPAPVEFDPTACQLDQDGSPAEPTRLRLDCQSTTWTVEGPWRDRETRYLDTDESAARAGWTMTKAVIVGGDARAWLTGHDLSCVATRDLLDTAEQIRVRCHNPEPTDDATTPPPPADSPAA